MDSESAKAQVIKEVRAQYAVENARQLIEVCICINCYLQAWFDLGDLRVLMPSRATQKVNEHCFEKCVPKPGASLSNTEQTCFTQCMEKYMSAWNQVSTTYIGRLQRQQQ